MWDPREIISIMCQHLGSIDTLMCDDNVFSGLDAHSEIQLHPILAKAFTNSRFGVLREVGYPSSPKSRPNQTQRQRCDLVITPDPSRSLFDPIDEQRTKDRAVGTLFESHAQHHQPDSSMVLPEDVLWIEVKAVGQFSYIDGVPGPNTKYTSELLQGPREDVIKLASEPLIHHGGALVIVFSEHQSTGTRDIATSVNAMIDQQLPVGEPEFETIEIMNHVGNAWCTLGYIPVKM